MFSFMFQILPLEAIFSILNMAYAHSALLTAECAYVCPNILFNIHKDIIAKVFNINKILTQNEEKPYVLFLITR